MTPHPPTTSPAGHRLPTSELAGAPVVVGFDDGASSVAAVRWAAVEAGRLGSALTVLSARDLPIETALGAGVVPPVPELWTVSRTTAARGAELARATSPGVAVSAVGVVGGPAGELVARSSGTGLLVVGRNRRSALQTAVLGSVSFAVAMHARCPVVVLREGADRHPGQSRPVVVGTDGSRPALAAISLALAFARAWQAPLRVVGAWQTPVLADGDAAPAMARAVLEELVAGAVDEARAADPSAEVTGVTAPGRPEDVLVEASRDAGIVVVGSRGRGGFAGLMLGSVSHGVMRRSAGPVVVVRRGSV